MHQYSPSHQSCCKSTINSLSYLGRYRLLGVIYVWVSLWPLLGVMGYDKGHYRRQLCLVHIYTQRVFQWDIETYEAHLSLWIMDTLWLTLYLIIDAWSRDNSCGTRPLPDLPRGGSWQIPASCDVFNVSSAAACGCAGNASFVSRLCPGALVWME